MSGSATRVLVSQKLKEMRKTKGLSQCELSELCMKISDKPKITQQRIAEIEFHNKNITLNTLDVLARALECSPHELVS